MTASPATLRDHPEHSGSAASMPRRVVSVSPQDVLASHGQGDSMMSDSNATPAPRVIDRPALERTIQTLRTLVERSAKEEQRLRDALEAAARAEAGSATAARQIQERLNLGARLLKASQAQIDRIEGLIADAERRVHLVNDLSGMEDRMAQAVDARVKAALESLDAQVESRVTAALDRILSSMASREEATAAQQKQLEQAEARVRAAIESAEGAADALGDLADGAASAGSLSAAMEELRQLMTRGASVSERLRQAVSDGEEAVESVEVRMATLRQRMLESAEICERRAIDVAEQMWRFDALDAELMRLREVEERITRALAALEPWRELLLDGDGTLASRRVAGIARAARDRLTAELRRTTASLRGLADQVDGLFPHEPVESQIEVKGDWPVVEVEPLDEVLDREIDSLPQAAD